MRPRRPRGLAAATKRAIARVRAGVSAYRAAKDEGIALSTIYRALKRAGLIGVTEAVEPQISATEQNFLE